MDVSITVDGIEETAQMLAGMPRDLVARGFMKALGAAGDVIEAAVWRRTPIDMRAVMNAAHGGKGIPLVGKLDQSIELDSQFRGGSVDVGFGEFSHLAWWLEYGHDMLGHASYLMRDGKILVDRKGKPRKDRSDAHERFIKHIAPKPFMRLALDGVVEQSIDAFAGALEDFVTANYRAPLQKTA